MLKVFQEISNNIPEVMLAKGDSPSKKLHNYQMTQNIVKIAITLVIILIMGLYLGVGVVSAQGEVLYTMGAILLVAIVAALGKKVWLLIPLVMLSSLSFRWIPGQWRTVDLAHLHFFRMRIAS